MATVSCFCGRTFDVKGDWGVCPRCRRIVEVCPRPKPPEAA